MRKESTSNSIRSPKTQTKIPFNIQQRPLSSNQQTFRRQPTKREQEDDNVFQTPFMGIKKVKKAEHTSFINPFASSKKSTSTSFGKPFQIDEKKKTDPDDDFKDSKSTRKSRSSRNSSLDDSRNIFTLPKRQNRDNDDAAAKFESIVQAAKEDASNKDKAKCPYCSEILFPLTDALEKALAVIEEKGRQYQKEQIRRFNEIEGTSEFSKSLTSVSERPVSLETKDAFCKLHKLELVLKPQGVKKGYPTSINFDELHQRVERFDAELKEIIRNKIKSDFRKNAEDAYKKLGKNKARSTTSLMNRFEMCLPGYYGPKGSSVILSILTEKYMNTGYLTKELKSPQLPLEFLQQVLVPEVGFRLIRQDLYRKNKSAVPMPGMNDKARSIMEESREYGTAMFPVENQKIEEDQSMTDAIVLNSDESDNDDNDSDGVEIIDQETISDDEDDESD